MTQTFEYSEYPVPDNLKHYLRRIMGGKLEAGIAEVPARPTGYCYVGWLRSGEGKAWANGQSFEINAGDTHLSGQLTTFDAYYSVQGPAEHWLAECNATGAHRLTKQDMQAIQNKCIINQVTMPNLSGSSSYEIFCNALELYAKDALGPIEKTEKAANLIESRNGNIKISELCEELGITERSLHRMFTNDVGLPPKSFAAVNRIIFALKLLSQDPRRNISEIALEAGFTDQAHLSNVFNLYMRASPSKMCLDDDGVLKSIVAGV